MSAFAEQVIAGVKEQELLWNKQNDGYSNRWLTDNAWANLADTLKRDKEEVKQKWRNLRDQFQRELRKLKILSSGEFAPYTGKWCHFESLFFLKDVMLSTVLRRNEFSAEKPPNNEESDDISPGWRLIVKEDPSLDDDDANEENPLDNDVNSHYLNPDPPLEVTMCSQPNWLTQSRRRKRSTSEIDKAKKKREDTEEVDDDMLFVKSLVPFLRNLTPVRKLVVRNEMHSILMKELLCDKCRTNGQAEYCRCVPS